MVQTRAVTNQKHKFCLKDLVFIKERFISACGTLQAEEEAEPEGTNQ